MLVSVTGFGSVWRHRLGKQDEGCRFRQAVYYNTTGVLVNGYLRQRPQICGYARFHIVGGFDPNHFSRMTDHVFESAEPTVWMGCNKLLFERVIKASEAPDCFLVVTKSELVGHLQVGAGNWRSSDTRLLSLSEYKGQQEAMLLMPIRGWIRSDFGRFVLAWFGAHPWRARLMLCGEEQ